MTIGDFELFCERNQVGMYRVAMQILNDSQRAEDAVQDAFMRMFRIVGRLEFETERAEKIYALRAAKSTAIDIIRREKPIDDLDGMNQFPSSCRDLTYDTVAALESAKQINNLLGPRAQTIFSFRNIGLSDTEIAATLNISVSNVRSIVYRARRSVSEAIQDGEVVII